MKYFKMNKYQIKIYYFSVDSYFFNSSFFRLASPCGLAWTFYYFQTKNFSPPAFSTVNCQLFRGFQGQKLIRCNKYINVSFCRK
jgi:hypothetical protein